jgi:hypothetical protein
MKLLWSSRSPFVRKVMVAAHEVGVADRISIERVVVAANKPNANVMAINRTVSQTATHVPFVSACTIRASWEHPCDRDHQLMMERSD